MSNIKLDVIVKQSANRTDGYIRFGQKPDGSFYQIPVIIIDGGKPGATLLVDACTHGDEFEGAKAIMNIAKEFEGKSFNGQIIAVPVINVEAYFWNRRSSLVDETNLNRISPGNDCTYLTPRLAHVHLERIVKCSNADAAITFHGGGNVLHLEPLAGYFPPENEKDEKAHKLAQAFNFPYTWRMQNVAFSGMISSDYRNAGIPTILPEIGSHCGRLHDFNKNVKMCEDGIKNVMAELKMIDPIAKTPIKSMDIELHYLHCYNGGLQTIVKRENEIVEEGETLAYMTDLFGNVIEELKAPYRGVVIGFWSVPVIKPGDWWSLYAKIL